jgi:hypothetical protein
LSESNRHPRAAQKYALDESAHEYVRAKLEYGGPLAQELFRRAVIDEPFTLLPANVSSEQLVAFDTGRYFDVGLGPWIEWIGHQLASMPNGAVFAENFELDPSSVLLVRKPDFALIDNSIVFFAVRTDSIENMLLSMSRYPSIVVIARNEGPPLERAQVVDPNKLAALAADATYVLVGAYDEESFVCATCRPTDATAPHHRSPS